MKILPQVVSEQMRRISLPGILLLLPLLASAQGTWTNLYKTGSNGLMPDFTDALHGSAVGPSGIVLRTSDGGVTWSGSKVRSREFYRGLDFLDADTGWVWSDTTLFKTVNGGTTWEQMENGQFYADFQFLNGRFGFSRSYLGPLHATVDGGKSWRVRYGSGFGVPMFTYAFTSPAVGFAVFAQDSSRTVTFLRKSLDSGATWTDQTVPAGLEIVSVQFADASRGWVAARNADGNLVILATVDGGASWRRRDTQTGGRFFDVRFATSALGWFMDYQVSNRPVLMVSRDSGATWAPSPAGFTGSVGRAQFVDSLVGYASGDGFISRTRDGGVTWSPVYKGIKVATPLASIRFADAATGWVAGTQGSVYKTRDGGMVWTQQVEGRATWKSLAVAGSLNVAVAGSINDSVSTDANFPNSGILVRSKDGGATWKETRFLNIRSINALHFPSQEMGVAAAYKLGAKDSTVFFKSTDGGDTWRRIAGPESTIPLRLQFLDTALGYLGASGLSDSIGGVFKTIDGGKSWQKVRRFKGLLALDMFWLTPDRGWFLTSPFVYATVDGGRTWTTSDSIGQVNMQSLAFTDAANGWIVTSSGQLLTSSDGGRTWKQDVPGMGGMEDVFFLPSGEGWAAGANGAINHFQPATTVLARGFSRAPAPAGYRIARDAVHFTLDRPGHVRILAIDAAGRLRMPIADGRFPIGAHQVPLVPALLNKPWFISFESR